MQVEFKYGKHKVGCEVPKKWETSVLDHQHPEIRPLDETVLAALNRPQGLESFGEWVRGKRILVIVCDVTRYTGSDRLMPVLYKNFLKDNEVEVLFALGNHRKQTEQEQRQLVSDAVFGSVRSIDHDCFDTTQLVSLGRVASGLEIAVNKRLNEAEAVVVTGSISFHYLAGFGGGRKALFPGISGYDTILGVHKSVFNPQKPGKHERVHSGIMEGNPMHETMMQALALVKTPLFLINTVFDDKKNFLQAFAGDIKTAHQTGCRWYSENFSVTPEEEADVVIVSAGGYPKDIDFIQSHKTLEHAKNALKTGGTMVVLAECADGPGNANFLPWFDYPTIEDMEPPVRASDKVYAQTAYSTRLKAQQYNIILVSKLGDDQVRKMGMTPRASVTEAIASLDTDKELLCRIIPNGSEMLVL